MITSELNPYIYESGFRYNSQITPLIDFSIYQSDNQNVYVVYNVYTVEFNLTLISEKQDAEQTFLPEDWVCIQRIEEN